MSEKFFRKEKRYLGPIFCAPEGTQIKFYKVRTDYYDFKKRGWSKGKPGPKVRVRTYDSGETFVEVKYGNEKKRKPTSEFLKKWISKLDYLFTITYDRYELILSNGSRVTQDINVCLNDKVALMQDVVEFKDEVPEWWRRKEAKGWSKSKWALTKL